MNNDLEKQNQKKSAANKHYSSRDCLEISLIPDNVSSNNLEETVLKISNETGVTVN